jgi:hypothetical protein
MGIGLKQPKNQSWNSISSSPTKIDKPLLCRIGEREAEKEINLVG